jgi:ribosome-associated toxin RatA of RatAB toxin-antitoxin module
MPEITIEAFANAPLEKVYATAQSVERFPEWMPDVESVTVLSREGSKVTSRWVGVVQEFRRKLLWTEEDIWDDARHKCTFRALEGDWEKYQGDWEFISEGTGTRLKLRLDFEFNVPLIGALIKGVLKKLVEKNSRGMLEAIVKQSEQ